MARQFVVQLDSRPGELARLIKSFEAFSVQIAHVACVGSGPLECLFVTTTDDDAARGVIKGLGHPFIEGEPLMVHIADRPGAFAAVSERLDAAGVHVTGLVKAGERPGFVEMAFCVDDIAAAREALGLCAADLVGVGD
jgi:hypothetical protein